MRHAETRNEKLALRLTPSQKRALQIAAILAGRSVSNGLRFRLRLMLRQRSRRG